jgi:phosphatidylglycerophosphate synthase
MKIKKTKFLSLGQIRKYHHKGQILKLRSMGIPLNFFKSPYTYLKSMYIIETSAILVFLLQNTKVTPNSITWIFVSLGLLSGLFLASNNDTLIFIGLIILFTNSTFDWADGLLARIKNKTSNLGSLLDTWGGLVCAYSYLLGFGIYLYNKDNDQLFIILTFFILLTRALDLKDYAYHYAMYQLSKVNRKDKFNFIKKLNVGSKTFYKKSKFSILNYVKLFMQNFIDERSRTVDIIIILIFIDTFYFDVILLNYIYYYICFRTIIIFAGGIYVTCYKNFLIKK